MKASEENCVWAFINKFDDDQMIAGLMCLIKNSL